MCPSDADSELPQALVMSSGQIASQVMPTYVSPGDNMNVKGAEMPKLPPGIPDVSTSERTVIGFGMYEKDDLVSAMKNWPSPRKSARSPTSSGFSPVMPLPRDLKFFESMNEPCDGPMIPGTSQRRRFKQ